MTKRTWILKKSDMWPGRVHVLETRIPIKDREREIAGYISSHLTEAEAYHAAHDFYHAQISDYSRALEDLHQIMALRGVMLKSPRRSK